MGRSAAQRRQRAKRGAKNKPASASWRERMGMKPRTKPGSNPERGKAYETGNRKTEREIASELPKPGSNPERGKAYETGNRKTERQIAAEQAAARNKPKPKPTKPAATKPKPKPKPTRPNPRMSGEGAPGARNAAKPKPKPKVKAGNNKKGDTKRLRDALKAVKKYKPKK